MNGNRTAEQYAEAAAASAQLAHERARDTADAALRMEQTAGRMERIADEMNRRLAKLESRVAVGLVNAKAAPAASHASLTELDFEDSPTGTHKLVSKRKFDVWAREREMSVDAKRWRKVLNVSGKIALLVTMAILGALIRHFIGR